jgi:hypothetical protein
MSKVTLYIRRRGGDQGEAKKTRIHPVVKTNQIFKKIEKLM